jgi:quercetin dioxygenase-like cupin family protein
MTVQLDSGPLFVQDFVDYQTGSIVSKEILHTIHGTVTLFAFSEGQGLSEHTAPFDVLAQIVDGKAEITISGKTYSADSGEMIKMPANVPHAVYAKKRFKMLLIMLKA